MLFALRASAVVAMLCAGCNGDETSSPEIEDAGLGAVVDATAAVDGPAEQSCAVQSDCPCFSNDDCPLTHTCTSLDDTGENVFCIEGERGDGLAGEPCTDEQSCASALCVEDDSGSFCSATCEDESTCPAVLPTCLFIGFGVDVSICAP